jgi:dCMP deaminase
MKKCSSCATVQLSDLCHICKIPTSDIPMRPSWAQVFLGMADVIAQRSDDVHKKLGCIIVSPANKVLAVGCNGLPRGIQPTPQTLNRPAKYSVMEHAERNAIYNSNQDLTDATLYVQMFPCNDCARAIIQKGITHVVVGATKSTNPLWLTKTEEAISMFDEANIDWRYHE